jgi:hypothetical protein|tara:strand:- start:60 stop:389 length:330 start_codon:yes stop_codon:yes gene_type:complete
MLDYLAQRCCLHHRQESFTEDEARETSRIGNIRIYIEEAFRRVREFKIMRNVIKLQQLDLIGQVFTVCALLTNYQGLLKLQPDQFAPGVSLAEALWYPQETVVAVEAEE